MAKNQTFTNFADSSRCQAPGDAFFRFHPIACSSKLASLAALVLLWSGSANASVIFNNGVVTPTHFPTSDISNNSQYTGHQILADDFTLLKEQEITDVHWTGSYFGANSPTVDTFTIEICTGLPAPAVCVPLVFSSGVIRTALGGGLFEYWVDVNPFLVSTAVHWITIYNNTSTDDATDWLWGSNLGGNAFQILNQDPSNLITLAGPWTQTNLNMDFKLTGVPEPASLALLGLGLAVLGFSRRK